MARDDFDNDTFEPPLRAEDVLSGEELRDYYAAQEAKEHRRWCRDPFCEQCNGGQEPEVEGPDDEEHPANLELGEELPESGDQCPTCQGSGGAEEWSPGGMRASDCPDCDGTGLKDGGFGPPAGHPATWDLVEK